MKDTIRRKQRRSGWQRQSRGKFRFRQTSGTPDQEDDLRRILRGGETKGQETVSSEPEREELQNPGVMDGELVGKGGDSANADERKLPAEDV